LDKNLAKTQENWVDSPEKNKRRIRKSADLPGRRDGAAQKGVSGLLAWRQCPFLKSELMTHRSSWHVAAMMHTANIVLLDRRKQG
jgi:hypothetical protein